MKPLKIMACDEQRIKYLAYLHRCHALSRQTVLERYAQTTRTVDTLQRQIQRLVLKEYDTLDRIANTADRKHGIVGWRQTPRLLHQVFQKMESACQPMRLKRDGLELRIKNLLEPMQAELDALQSVHNQLLNEYGGRT